MSLTTPTVTAVPHTMRTGLRRLPIGLSRYHQSAVIASIAINSSPGANHRPSAAERLKARFRNEGPDYTRPKGDTEEVELRDEPKSPANKRARTAMGRTPTLEVNPLDVEGLRRRLLENRVGGIRTTPA